MLAIHAVPAFKDNYIWILEEGGKAVAVDPGDAAPVEAFLESRDLELTAVLATHHHADHVGGLPALASHWRCPTFGPKREVAAHLDQRLEEGDRFAVPGIDIALETLDIPGHTAGHIALFGAGVVFCGDTLFACADGPLIRDMIAARESAKRARNEPTLPSTIGEELATNPFLRCAEPDVIAAAEHHAGRKLKSTVEVFAEVREWKNNS